ncbi:D-alanyl-lipoteichoic acid acyltransferase DltB, MBOAT superfamily [Janthinobacterium sp. OK676]|uniref:MBOAT family O-acyltransferase n=1 Tax=Janthinobacterium sp. OK676 TaxID=1855295 RepID=UPI000886D842|nr:MBOAT family O-acyltransferase [Janthinobacterium sp. OK676]SDM99534.1 D-alanyl-lipoteichoic acid acyltransferase DltB, MBOAT superfamily [Janthinobacterium sp. OK676]
MLFNSWIFLFAYLPVTVAGFFILGRRKQLWAAAWLAAASLFFYAYWDYRYLPLLLGSVVFNYGCAAWLAASPPARKKWILAAAIAANLGLLAYYKYAGFFLASLAQLLERPMPALHVILPIGISFFTFTQIAFLVDTCKGKVQESRFVHYLLFVTYFPHLIAGPVLHHKEMMPQFADRRTFRLSASNIAIGSTIFFIGLAKKVLVADNIGAYAAPLFSDPVAPSLLVAWAGVLAYAFQLYFDFSGYSDMAIGLSRLFGVRLPLNFDSPYKSRNIAQFWRRWHMTLSRFLRDYLYIPLGGKRCGPLRRYLNLMITMVLGGLWHGAGWNFIVWGALHGAYLAIHKGWSAVARQWHLPSDTRVVNILATILTFTAVCLAWVFFRAPDLATALTIIKGMAGGFGLALPDVLAPHLLPLQPVLGAMGMAYYLGGGTAFIESWTWIAVAALITFALPNTQQIMRHFDPALNFQAGGERMLAWRASPGWAAAIAVLALASMLALNRPAEFLYFQF